MTMVTSATLRGRQAELARRSILDAASAGLLNGNPDTMSLAEVAEQAGVSARTLYRYFPARDALMAAALEHLNEELGLVPEVDPDDIGGTFLAGSARMAQYPTLVRNLNQTAAGRNSRSAYREGRARQFADAVLALAPPGMDSQSVRAAGAVVASLCGSAAWVTLCDEQGLSVEEARAAVAWTIETLIETIRRGQGPRITPGGREHHD